MEEESSLTGTYKHMIQRLTGEVQLAKKATFHKEEEISRLENELVGNNAVLMTARQEKAATEQGHKNLLAEMQITREDHNRALADLELALQQTHKKFKILERREHSRQQVMAQAMGELSVKQSKKLKQEQFLKRAQYQEMQRELATTEEAVLQLEVLNVIYLFFFVCNF